jgi:hypothetical protein
LGKWFTVELPHVTNRNFCPGLRLPRAQRLSRTSEPIMPAARLPGLTMKLEPVRDVSIAEEWSIRPSNRVAAALTRLPTDGSPL